MAHIAAIFEPRINDKVRICFNYDGLCRPLVWFLVGKDGSIYIGPRKTKLSELHIGHAAIENNKCEIKYKELSPVDMQTIECKIGASLHSSGAINMAGKRIWRPNFRNTITSQELAVILFQHPSEFDGISKIKKRDVIFNYPINERMPFFCNVIISPLDRHESALNEKALYQVNFSFVYKGMSGCCDYILQFLFSHAAEGQWPKYTIMCLISE